MELLQRRRRGGDDGEHVALVSCPCTAGGSETRDPSAGTPRSGAPRRSALNSGKLCTQYPAREPARRPGAARPGPQPCPPLPVISISSSARSPDSAVSYPKSSRRARVRASGLPLISTASKRGSGAEAPLPRSVPVVTPLRPVRTLTGSDSTFPPSAARDQIGRGDRADRGEHRADDQGGVHPVDERLRRALAERRGARDQRAEERDADRAIPAWRNVSFTPAARPLCSCGTDPSATAAPAGL